MEWSDVRIFLAVARGGSFGSAARALKVSHPTVGRRIAVLTGDTGQPLFRRTANGLVLTDAGDSILAIAEAMESAAFAVERRLTGASESLEGILRISAADWFAVHVLAPILAELVRIHPGITPEVIAGYRLLDLSRRDADVAFRIVPFAEPDIVQRRLMTMRYGLYGTRATAHRVQKDSASVGLIVMDTAQSYFPDVAWLRDKYPRARRAFTSTSRSVQAQMCAQGAGLAVLPRALGDAVPGLTLIDPDDAPPSRDIWVGYHRDLRQMDRLRVMLDIASARLTA